ncbi:hypothetical protein CPB83DRAFT_907483 [Crepidotus variabilis]|uniref:F-box domain-containing protein n=1 Tax=Crepidotus variabilis TaxID=179855 RepID=A0A9P6EEZ9_9AGAR|nr:hypothetical protein CPB83DRAFT_907483 [Crepidotus variabilis]
MLSFQELPVEILEKILVGLDFRDILSCQCVSQSLDNAVRNSPDLNYQIMLQRSGNIDNSHCTQAIAEKRDTLERSEFCWSSRALIPPGMDGEGRLANHFRVTKLLGFTDRFLIYGARETGKDEDIPTHLIYTLLPSNIDSLMNTTAAGVPAKDWVIRPPPPLKGSKLLGLATNIHESGIIVAIYGCPEEDNPQNLPIYMVVSDDNASDPTDFRHIIYVTTVYLGPPENVVSITANAEISGKNIAFVLHTSFLEEGHRYSFYGLTVVDWETGIMKTLPKEGFLPVGGPGLAFLSSKFLLVPNLLHGSIDVYHIPNPTSEASQDDRQDNPSPLILSLVASWILPELVPELNSFIDIDIQCSPNPFGDDETSSRIASSSKSSPTATPPSSPSSTPEKGTPAHVKRPYFADPQQAIMAITMKIANREPSEDDSIGLAMPRLFIHRQSLLDIFLPLWKEKLQDAVLQSPARPAQPPRDSILSIPWEDWGPERSRWLSIGRPEMIDGEPGSNLRKFCVYGQRHIVLVSSQSRSTEVLDPNDTPEKDLVTLVALLYDFNPLTSKILLQNEHALKEKEKIAQEGKEGTPLLVHSGVQLGYDPNIKHQMPYKVISPDDPNSTENRFKLQGATIFKQDLDGGVVGRLGYVRYSLPGLPGIDDIAIDARRIIQRELKNSTDTMILSLYFG